KIRQIISDFHPADPALSVAELLELRQALSELKDDDWVPEKKAELDQIIAACLGLHVEASTTNATITPGQTADIKLEAINRCNIPVTLQEVGFPLSGDWKRIDAALPPNELVAKDLSCKIPENTPYSQPYWLHQPGTLGTFAVGDQRLIGLPENPPHLPMEITLQVSEGRLRAIASIDGREYAFGRVRISYPHIGVHTLMPAAEVKVVRADIRKKGERIGYIPGAGDDVPESLQQIGYSVKMLSDGDITEKNLAQFSA